MSTMRNNVMLIGYPSQPVMDSENKKATFKLTVKDDIKNGCQIDGQLYQEWPKILYDNPYHTEFIKCLAKIDSMPKNTYYKMKGGRQ